MTNLNTRTPSGDGVTQRIDMKPAFSEDLLRVLCTFVRKWALAFQRPTVIHLQMSVYSSLEL